LVHEEDEDADDSEASSDVSYTDIRAAQRMKQKQRKLDDMMRRNYN